MFNYTVSFFLQLILCIYNSGSQTSASHSDSPHIDIYDNSDVQPPSYLNVKDAPEDVSDFENRSNYHTNIKENGVNVGGQNERSDSDSNAGKYLSDQETSNKPNVKNKSASRNSSKERKERVGYNLTRSKSVCDFSAINHAKLLDTDSVFDVPQKRILEQSSVANISLASLSTTNSGASCSPTTTYGVLSTKSNNSVKTEKGSTNQQKVSKIVRNRTILGSFPLFYKLSQSLSSLNSGGLSFESASTNKSTFPTTNGNPNLLGKEYLFSENSGISSLYYPKSSTNLPVQPGATLGGAMNVTSSIITEYDTGCFYVQDSSITDR